MKRLTIALATALALTFVVAPAMPAAPTGAATGTIDGAIDGAGYRGVIVTRDEAGSAYTVAWASGPKRATKVYVGTDPAVDTSAAAVATAPAGTTTATVGGLDPARRYYLEILPASAKRGLLVADRELHLESAPNARDIGGYETADGHHVASGAVYRSDALGKATDADLATIGNLGIKVVCDFRAPSEIEADGADRLPPGSSTEVVNLPIYDEGNDTGKQIRQAIVTRDFALQRRLLGDGRSRQVLIDGSRSYVTDPKARAQFAAMLDRLADPAALPAVTNCTQGKDRTGWAAAVILTALGVPRKTVLEDYLLTNVYAREKMDGQLRAAGPLLYDPEALRPLVEADRAYLRASFDAIREKYGTFDAYLRRGLGVDRRQLAQLRRNLLTD